jgi:hypothetical protein
MRDSAATGYDALSQSEILRRLTALLIQVGDLAAPPEGTCEASWREGVLIGLCLSTAVAGGAGMHGQLPIKELAALGLDLARSVDWTVDD